MLVLFHFFLFDSETRKASCKITFHKKFTSSCSDRKTCDERFDREIRKLLNGFLSKFHYQHKMKGRQKVGGKNS